MAEPQAAKEAKLFCGILTKYRTLLDEVAEELVRLFGEVETRSETMPFDVTDYYAESMGSPLLRQFVSFKNLIGQERLREIKLTTNRLERRVAESGRFDVLRPVNIDPGYMTPSRLVLASCKDFSHRIYLGDGVYAEVTLLYRKGDFCSLDWTYPDYRSRRYMDYFRHLRTVYLEQLRHRRRDK